MSLIWEHKDIASCTPTEVLSWCKLRTDVFFLEQHITEEEIDALDSDPATQHIWCHDGTTTVGYVRVVRQEPSPPGDHGITTSIGRLVVHEDYRRQGLAAELMRRALDACGDGDVILHAQTYIQDFYAGLGFERVGEEFDEAGIAHIRMVRKGST